MLYYAVNAQWLRYRNRPIESALRYYYSDTAVWSCAHKAPRRMAGQMRGRSCRSSDRGPTLNSYVLCLHHTAHPCHSHRHQVLAMYRQGCIEVILTLQMQWTKLWRANELNSILTRGASIVWSNLDCWLTVLQYHALSVRHPSKIWWIPRPSWTWVHLESQIF